MIHPTLDGDALLACQRYIEVRPRLVAASHPAKSESIDNLADLIGRIDAFVLDGYGVLNLGPEAIAGAADRVEQLRDSGARVVVLTNGATLPHEQAVEKYESLGFSFDSADVVSSRDALEEHLNTAALSRHWGVMAPTYAQADALTGKNRSIHCTILEDDPKTYRAVSGFILLSSADWNADRQQLLVDTLREQPRPVLVGNPDLVAPFADGMTLEPGWYAHDLHDKTGCMPRYFGKPFADVYDLVNNRLRETGSIDPRRIAMVGDTLHTDVLGGAAAGWKTVLVTGHGLLKGQDAADVIARSNIRPDFICPTT
jgi:HAD superfamily hydrolase (TIGR01450 family)